MHYENDTPKGLGVDVFAATMERSNRRLFILCLVLLFALITSNLAWEIREQGFATEVVTIEAEQEAEMFGKNYIVGGSYGDETESKDN